MNKRETGHNRRYVGSGVFLCCCAMVICGLLAMSAMASEDKPLQSGKQGTAKSVIEIWLWGGSSQLETFDPKPDAGDDYNGGFKAIPTNVPGMEISEFLPKLAKQAEKYSLIRSMTHGITAHETAAYFMQTGREPGGKVYPGIGAVIGMMKGYDYGYKGKIPPYIVITESKGRFSEIGFLNPKYKPLVTGGDPNAAVFAVEGIVNAAVTKEQQKKNREFLVSMDSLGRVLPQNVNFDKFEKSGDEAYDLITGEAGSVFDLGRESNETRELYGRNWFGQSCLAARRMVEAGVPYITINSPGWDTHKRHFQLMRNKLQQVDQGLSALLQDLKDKGLLDTTIVWCCGEFGRQPKVSTESPWNGGRQHYGKCFSALVAGGGFMGGKIVGSSDEKAENPVDRPVYPQDFLGSIYELMGIDPDGKMPNPMGEDITVMPPQSKFGRLKEIYEFR
ncbi:MAG: DUF1501 domain-containing protein [Lentisphaerae bacterium]|nr:DUF1501 domain-containing protein [Lentisphaerota bacterium]